MQGPDTKPSSTPGWLIAVTIVLATLLSTAAWVHDWRSAVPDSDQLPDIQSAIELVEHGQAPSAGVLSSLRSYVPPGAAWALAPGAALFRDIRLMPVPGLALLHLATLVGVFVLARRAVGVPAALLAVLLYACSDRGLFFSAPHGPRGEPCFVVWMVVCALRWVDARDARWLAASLTAWGLGLYLFLESLPAIVLVPALWLVYRPPLTTRWLAASLVLVGAVWTPYLHFEWQRGFIDLQSQLARRPIVVASLPQDWCDHSIPLPLDGTVQRDDAVVPPNLSAQIGRRVLGVTSGLTVPFSSPIPGGAALPTALLMLGVLARVLSACERPGASWLTWTAAGVSTVLLAAASAVGRLAAVVAPGTRFTVDTLDALHHAGLVLGATGAMLGCMAFPAARVALARAWSPRAPSVDALALAVLVPLVAMLALVENSRTERVGYLAPLVVILLVTVLVSLRFTRADARAGWRIACAVAAVAVMAPIVTEPGWTTAVGRDVDPPEVAIVRRLAERMSSERLTHASVGVNVGLGPVWGPAFLASDARYRPTILTDLVLGRHAGLTNDNGCREGVSAQDRYRIIQREVPDDEDWRLQIPPGRGFVVVDRVDTFDLLERREAGLP